MAPRPSYQVARALLSGGSAWMWPKLPPTAARPPPSAGRCFADLRMSGQPAANLPPRGTLLILDEVIAGLRIAVGGAQERLLHPRQDRGRRLPRQRHRRPRERVRRSRTGGMVARMPPSRSSGWPARGPNPTHRHGVPAPAFRCQRCAVFSVAGSDAPYAPVARGPSCLAPPCRPRSRHGTSPLCGWLPELEPGVVSDHPS